MDVFELEDLAIIKLNVRPLHYRGISVKIKSCIVLKVPTVQHSEQVCKKLLQNIIISSTQDVQDLEVVQRKACPCNESGKWRVRKVSQTHLFGFSGSFPGRQEI